MQIFGALRDWWQHVYSIQFLTLLIILFFLLRSLIRDAQELPERRFVGMSIGAGFIAFLAIGAAFNKKYGLNVKLQYSPSGNMTRDIGKVVGLGASGVPPEWDLMVVTDAHHATLWVKKMHQPFDYKSIGVDPKAVQYDNGSVSFANQFVLPAYNKQLVPANDVPKPMAVKPERQPGSPSKMWPEFTATSTFSAGAVVPTPKLLFV